MYFSYGNQTNLLFKPWFFFGYELFEWIGCQCVLGSMVYEAKGVAVSGLYILNHTAHDYDGLFLSGGINFTAGVLHGIQIAGIMNSLGEVYGTQVSGMFNLAETLRGIQFPV